MTMSQLTINLRNDVNIPVAKKTYKNHGHKLGLGFEIELASLYPIRINWDAPSIFGQILGLLNT